MKYEHYDITDRPKWAVVHASEMGTRVLEMEKFNEYLKTEYAFSPGEEIPLSESDKKMIDEAQQFVEAALGMPLTCSVGKYSKLRGDVNGCYDYGLDRVGFTRADTGSDYGDTIALGSLLVHELTHSTGRKTTRTIDLHDRRRGIHTLCYMKPHEEVDISSSYQGESFLEEALAEEIASRWREQFDPRLAGRRRELMTHGDNPAIPLSMYNPAFPVDMTTRDTQRGYRYSAYCAYGVSLMSEYLGIDLFQLMIDARDPKKSSNATKQLKNAIDSIEPELYHVLMGAGYSEQDFVDGLLIIQQAIDKANAAYSICLLNR